MLGIHLSENVHLQKAAPIIEKIVSPFKIRTVLRREATKQVSDVTFVAVVSYMIRFAKPALKGKVHQASAMPPVRSNQTSHFMVVPFIAQCSHS